MKILTRYLALAAIAVILGSCSFAIGALNHKKSRVVASAIWHPRSTTTTTRTVRSVTTARAMSPLVAKRRVLPPKPASAFVRPSRSVAPVASTRTIAPAVSKDISASTDIDYITYTVTNLDPSSGEPDINDFLDPNYPYIDIFLTPGQNYRITIDVFLLSSSPLAGNTMGITGYGDAADIAVPADGSDVWVDMTIHAEAVVIKNQTAAGPLITYVDPTTGGTSVTPAVTGGLPGTTAPQDKFFYTSDSLLYYFNFSAKQVWGLTNLTTSPSAALAIDGTNVTAPGLTNPIQIYAICPDPAFAGWFYVAGFDATLGQWQLWVVNYDPAGLVGPTTNHWYYVDNITSYLQFGNGITSTVSVTGVAADPYGFAYITFYNTLTPTTGNPVSGMVEFDSYGAPGATFFDQRILDTSGGWTNANSIFTDAMYGGSNIYLLASPNTSPGTAGVRNHGTADVYEYDIYLNQLSANPSPVHQTYTTGSAISLGTGSSLTLPNKFVGTPQGGTFFVSQTDFAAGGPDVLSTVPLDLSSVTVP
jgi:hypothetical protein